ncbi:MAG: WD40 repeat domain-containing protein [Verrucomicrobiota bacterium]
MGAGRVTSLAFHPNGRVLATGSGVTSRSGTIKLWKTYDGAMIREAGQPHKDLVTGLAFNHGGDTLASSSADKFVKTWRVSDLSLVRSFEGHTGYAQDVAWKSDGLFLASAGADKVIKVWDVEAEKQKETISGYGKEVTALCYLGLDDTLLSGSGDPSVKVGKTALSGVSEFVHDVAVDPAGSILVAGGEDGIMRIWNAKDRKLLFTFGPPAGE